MASGHTISKPNDPVIQQSPSDTIQCIKFAPVDNVALLAGVGWDSSAYLWEIFPNSQNTLKQQTQSNMPILSCSWIWEQQTLALGGCNNQVMLWNLQQNQLNPVGQHQAPVKEVFWCAPLGMVISGSWDGTVKFWDLRQPQPAISVDLTGKVFCMSQNANILAAGLSDKRVAVWDLQRIQQNSLPDYAVEQNAQYQIKTMALSSDGKYLALGLLEGRCGSDGSVIYWDRIAKARIKAFTQLGNPVTAIDFKNDSTLFAYALGYDWSKGSEFAANNLVKIGYRLAHDEAMPRR